MRCKKSTKFIFTSSSSVYGGNKNVPWTEESELVPLNPYAQTKITGERIIKSFTDMKMIRGVSIRPFNVFGEHMDPKSKYSLVLPLFSNSIDKGEPITIYGYPSRDFTYVGDVCDAIRKLIGTRKMIWDGRAYNLCSGTPYRIYSIAYHMMMCKEKDVEIVFKEKRDYESVITHGNYDRIKNDLRWNPTPNKMMLWMLEYYGKKK